MTIHERSLVTNDWKDLTIILKNAYTIEGNKRAKELLDILSIEGFLS